MTLWFIRSKLPWNGERIDQDGEPCACIRHPPNIEALWTEEELAAIGLTKEDPNPKEEPVEEQGPVQPLPEGANI